MRIKDIEAKIEDKLTFDRGKLPRVTAVKWVPRRFGSSTSHRLCHMVQLGCQGSGLRVCA